PSRPPTPSTAVTVENSQPVTFNIILVILDSLHFDSGVGKFSGRLAMALVNAANHADTSALLHDVPVLVGADGADFTPQSLTFTQLNAPQEIRLAVLAPADPYSVQAMTALNHDPDSIVMPIQRPDIVVRAISSRIRGLGLEETNLVVRVTEAKGHAGQEVVLQPSRGTVTPSTVKLDDQGSGTAT